MKNDEYEKRMKAIVQSRVSEDEKVRAIMRLEADADWGVRFGDFLFFKIIPCVLLVRVGWLIAKLF